MFGAKQDQAALVKMNGYTERERLPVVVPEAMASVQAFWSCIVARLSPYSRWHLLSLHVGLFN